MRIALILVALVAGLAGLIWLVPHDGGLPEPNQRMEAPWGIEPLPGGGTRVLGIDLGTARFDDAMTRFGAPESIGLFLNKEGARSLEAYFGDVYLGPMMRAKVIVTLEADTSLLDALAANAIGREGTREGDAKLLLAGEDKARLGALLISGMTCIPSYSGLEADFFRERLGPPAATRQESEHAQSWFYPDLGLSLVIDAEGGEVFEYRLPSRFTLPTDTVAEPH